MIEEETPILEAKEQLAEPQLLDFESYETFCNQDNQSSRKAGILASEIYEAALVDPRTVFAEIDGVSVPILVDIELGLGLGYDVTRAEASAGTEIPISALAVPVGDLSPDVQETVIAAIKNGGPRSIFFADNEARDQTALSEGLADNNFIEKPLLDRRCRPENRQASLSLYVSDNILRDHEATAENKVPLSAVQAYYDEHVLPRVEDPANAAMLKNGADFTPEELEQIGDLYIDKFELLGENHPISMEDSREDFLEVLTDPSMTVSVQYVEGKPVCFTYFTDKFDSLFWLNEDYLKRLEDERPELTPVFFPGIVSGKAAGNYPHEVIALFAETAAATDLSGRIIFENTNLSEMYVPRIVDTGISSEPRYHVEKPHKVDQTMYRLATVNTEPVSLEAAA